MAPKITKELQDTLLACPHVKTVYFDASGKHWFIVHKLKVSKNSDEEALFGQGIFSHRQIIPGVTNIDLLTEDIAVGDSSSRIMSQMSVEDVHKYEVESTDMGIVGQIANATTAQKTAILGLLGLSPAAIKMMNDAAENSEVKEEPAPKINLSKK